MKMDLYKVPKEFKYDGIVFPGTVVRPEYIEKIRDLNTREGDVIVAGYPRSGNNWIQYAITLVQNDANLENAKYAYAKKRFFLEVSFKGNFAKSVVMNAIASKHNERLLMTHLPFKYLQKQIIEECCKTIVVVRNPKDVLISYFNFYKINTTKGPFPGSWDEFFNLYKHKHIAWGDWSDHLSSYWEHRHLSNMLFITYEDAKRNLRNVVKKIAEFLGKELSEEKISDIVRHLDIESMKSDPVTSSQYLERIGILKENSLLRRGNVGDWKQLFSQEQSDLVDKRCGYLARQIGLELNSHL